MKAQTDFIFPNGMTAAQFRDICRNLIELMGPKAYTEWALANEFELHEITEAKLLEVHGRHTRAEDREHFEQLCQERRFALMQEALS